MKISINEIEVLKQNFKGLKLYKIEYEEYIIRPLTRIEYRQLIKIESREKAENIICKLGIVWSSTKISNYDQSTFAELILDLSNYGVSAYSIDL